MFGEAMFIFDKDFTTVLGEYDVESEEYLAVQALYKMMSGEE